MTKYNRDHIMKIEKDDLITVVSPRRQQEELICRVKDVYLRKRDSVAFYEVIFLYNGELSDSLIEEKFVKKVYKMFEVNNNEMQ